LGGGLYVAANGAATVTASTISQNDADGGEEGKGGADGHGYGGGVAYQVGSVLSLDALTVVKHNHASTSGDNIYQQP
jgi:hypothetical protein